MKNTFATILAGMLLVGCSSVHTQKANVRIATLNQTERFQLLVRTGNAVLDKLLYEMAYQKFSEVLPIKEKEPYTGTMEITFASSDQSWFVSNSSSIGVGTVSGSGWYSGTGYIDGTATVSGVTTTASTGSSFTWQNSTMLVVLKRQDGERLWTADYNYKGGWEMSGWVVNTPDEAARLVVKRIRQKFDQDFRK